MKRSPYSAYHGRKTLAHKLLTAIVILLVIILALALVALFVLPSYVVYTADGPKLELPLFSGLAPASSRPTAPVTAEPSPTDDPAIPSDVVVEPPSTPPSPTPAVPSDLDLSQLERRDMPLGLVTTAGAGPRQGDGSIFDMTGDMPEDNSDLSGDRAAARELNLSLPYAAAWLAPDWDAAMALEDFSDRLVQRCLALADSGYDEIIFSACVPADDGAGLARLYRDVKDALDQAGWQGRLGLVMDQSLFDARYDADLIPAVAQSFERLYFHTTLKNANKNALTDNGFVATGYTLVTVVQNPANLNYAWAVLP